MTKLKKDNDSTTITLTRSTRDLLVSMKVHPRETYDQCITRLLNHAHGTSNGETPADALAVLEKFRV